MLLLGCTLLSPWFPEQEAQQVQNEHGGLHKCAEKGLVVLLLHKHILTHKRKHFSDT